MGKNPDPSRFFIGCLTNPQSHPKRIGMDRGTPESLGHTNGSLRDPFHLEKIPKVFSLWC